MSERLPELVFFFHDRMPIPLRARIATPPEARPEAVALAEEAQALQPKRRPAMHTREGSSAGIIFLVSCISTQSAELRGNTAVAPDCQQFGFVVSNAHKPSCFHQTSSRDVCGWKSSPGFKSETSSCRAPGVRRFHRCRAPVSFLMRLDLRGLPALQEDG